MCIRDRHKHALKSLVEILEQDLVTPVRVRGVFFINWDLLVYYNPVRHLVENYSLLREELYDFVVE